MKKYRIIQTEAGNYIGGTYATPAEAAEALAEYITDANDTYGHEPEDTAQYLTPFDFKLEKVEASDYTEVKTYADACKVLGVEPMDEAALAASGFRPDEIARRKLETITAAINDGWQPDWANTDQWKYYPYFRIVVDSYSANAGLSCAVTSCAASHTATDFGSRLCFHDHATARYAGKTFTELYEQILVK